MKRPHYTLTFKKSNRVVEYGCCSENAELILDLLTIVNSKTVSLHKRTTCLRATKKLMQATGLQNILEIRADKVDSDG